MEQKIIEQKIKEILVKKGNLTVEPESIKVDDSLNNGDFALDSIQKLEVLVGIEDEFDIVFNDDDVMPELFNAVSVLVEYVLNAPKIRLEDNS